jgi:hypothetical protein
MGVRLKWSKESMKQNKKQGKSCWCFFGRNQLFFEHASRVARLTAEKRAQLNKRLIVKNQLFAWHLCFCLSIWCFLSTYVFLLQETVVCYSVSMYPMLLGWRKHSCFVFICQDRSCLWYLCVLLGTGCLFSTWFLQGNNCFIEHLFHLSGISCLLSTCLGWRAMPLRSTVFSPSSGTTCSGSAPAFTFLKVFRFLSTSFTKAIGSASFNVNVA